MASWFKTLAAFVVALVVTATGAMAHSGHTHHGTHAASGGAHVTADLLSYGQAHAPTVNTGENFDPAPTASFAASHDLPRHGHLGGVACCCHGALSTCASPGTASNQAYAWIVEPPLTAGEVLRPATARAAPPAPATSLDRPPKA